MQTRKIGNADKKNSHGSMISINNILKVII